jgi:hypothetical protein
LFNHEFVTRSVPDDAMERARKNLESEAMKEELRMRPNDAHQAQSLLTQQRAQQLYYYQQAPPQNYLSPVAWMQFFEAWKRGDFKKKTTKKKIIYVEEEDDDDDDDDEFENKIIETIIKEKPKPKPKKEPVEKKPRKQRTTGLNQNTQYMDKNIPIGFH